MKIVLIVSKEDGKRVWSELLKIAAGTVGIDKIAMEGEERNIVVITGEGVDAVKLVSKLRKKVGPIELLRVGPDDDVKEEVTPAPDDEKKKTVCSVM